MSQLRELLPANRLAALTGIVIAVIAFLVALQSSFTEGSPAAEAIGKGIVMLGSVLTVLKIITTFMEGSQNFDSLILSGQPKNSGGLVNTTANAVSTGDADTEAGAADYEAQQAALAGRPADHEIG